MSAILEAEPQTFVPPGVDEDQHVVIWADWDRYERYLAARGANNPGLRLTYDRGTLEFTSISSENEKLKYLMGRIVDAITEELNIPLVGQGETTVRRKDLDRGFEPDAWYYIQHALQMQGIDRELDFEIDPPPDLAIEIEIARSLINRLGLCAALGMKEIWRCSDAAIRVLVLQPNGEYAEAANSLALPLLTVADLNRIVNEVKSQDPTAYFRGLRTWVREHLLTLSNKSAAETSSPQGE